MTKERIEALASEVWNCAFHMLDAELNTTAELSGAAAQRAKEAFRSFLEAEYLSEPRDNLTMPFRIENIRRGEGTRRHILYGSLRAANGTLLVSATLDYIVTWLEGFSHNVEED